MLNKVNGRIYLIPVTLGGDDFLKVIPEKVIALTRQLRYFVVEDIRSARRFLRLIDKEFPINDTVFYELNKHTENSDIEPSSPSPIRLPLLAVTVAATSALLRYE